MSCYSPIEVQQPGLKYFAAMTWVIVDIHKHTWLSKCILRFVVPGFRDKPNYVLKIKTIYKSCGIRLDKSTHLEN